MNTKPTLKIHEAGIDIFINNAQNTDLYIQIQQDSKIIGKIRIFRNIEKIEINIICFLKDQDKSNEVKSIALKEFLNSYFNHYNQDEIYYRINRLQKNQKEIFEQLEFNLSHDNRDLMICRKEIFNKKFKSDIKPIENNTIYEKSYADVVKQTPNYNFHIFSTAQQIANHRNH